MTSLSPCVYYVARFFSSGGGAKFQTWQCTDGWLDSEPSSPRLLTGRKSWSRSRQPAGQSAGSSMNQTPCRRRLGRAARRRIPTPSDPIPLHPSSVLFSRTTCVSRYRNGKTSPDLNEARDDGVLGRQWHQLDNNYADNLHLAPDR